PPWSLRHKRERPPQAGLRRSHLAHSNQSKSVTIVSLAVAPVLFQRRAVHDGGLAISMLCEVPVTGVQILFLEDVRIPDTSDGQQSRCQDDCKPAHEKSLLFS